MTSLTRIASDASKARRYTRTLAQYMIQLRNGEEEIKRMHSELIAAGYKLIGDEYIAPED